MRFGRIFYVIVLLICIFETARLWNISPTQMAVHFDAQGNPNRFTTKEQFFGFELETMLVVVGLGILTQVFALMTPVQLINMPNRDYWLAPERRRETIGRLSSFAAMLFGIVTLAVQAGFELAVSANLHQPIVFDAQTMFLVIVGFVALSMLMLVWLVMSFQLPSSKA